MRKCAWYYGTKNKETFKQDVKNMKRCGLNELLFHDENTSAQMLWELAEDTDLEINIFFDFGRLYSLAMGQAAPRVVLSKTDDFNRRFSPKIKETELVCWSQVENIDKIVSYLKNFLKSHPFLKGVNFDLLRYPNTVFQEDFPCECRGCQERRHPWLGRGILTEKDMKDPSILYKEIETKNQVITKFAKKLAAVTQKSGLKFSISARTIYAGRDLEFNSAPTWGYGPAIYEGQDWAAWCRDGILDEIHFMNYAKRMDRFARIAKQHKDLLQKCSVAIYEGLGVSSSAGKMSPGVFSDQIKLTKNLGMTGVTIFSWNTITEEHMRILERV